MFNATFHFTLKAFLFLRGVAIKAPRNTAGFAYPWPPRWLNCLKWKSPENANPAAGPWWGKKDNSNKTFPDGLGILFFMSWKQGRELVKSHLGEYLAASFSEAGGSRRRVPGPTWVRSERQLFAGPSCQSRRPGWPVHVLCFSHSHP